MGPTTPVRSTLLQIGVVSTQGCRAGLCAQVSWLFLLHSKTLLIAYCCCLVLGLHKGRIKNVKKGHPEFLRQVNDCMPPHGPSLDIFRVFGLQAMMLYDD